MRYFLGIAVVSVVLAPKGWGQVCMAVAGNPTAGASFQDHATYETTTLHVRVPAGDKVQLCDITPAMGVLVSGTVPADATTGTAPVPLTAPLIAGHMLQLQVQAANAGAWQNAGTILVENVCEVPSGGAPQYLAPVAPIGVGVTGLSFNIGPGPPRRAVQICDLGQNTVLPSGPATADAMGPVAITLTTPLGNGQVIQVQVQAPGATKWNNAGSPLTIPVPAPNPPVTLQSAMQGQSAIREGVSSIQGTAGNNKGATIQLKDVATGMVLGKATSDPKDGTFTLTLDNPLYAGEKVRLLVDGNQGLADDITTPGVADWGRWYFEFAAGLVLSVDNNFQAASASSGSSGGSTGNSTQTTQSTLFLLLNAEKNWRWMGFKAGTKDWAGRWMFNTFFQTRLTSLPVTTCQTAPTTSQTPAPSLRFNGSPRFIPLATTDQTAATNNNQSSCDNVATFLISTKAAMLQGGVYIPFRVVQWTWKNAPNSLILAPIAKIGFSTPTGSTSTTVSGTTTSQAVNQGQFYNFYTFSGRLGYFTHSADKNSAPKLQTYIDAGVGRFSNLPTLVPVFYNGTQLASNGMALSSANADTTPYTAQVRRWRVAIEGNMKIPMPVPLTIGFSANLGQNFFGPPLNYCGPNPCTAKGPSAPLVGGVAAKDDLRFFIGTQFDVGKLAAKLPSF